MIPILILFTPDWLDPEFAKAQSLILDVHSGLQRRIRAARRNWKMSSRNAADPGR